MSTDKPDNPYADFTFDVALAHRIVTLGRRLAVRCEGIVQSGPFAGMRFDTSVADGCLLPKMLGCYEMELHPVIADAVAREPDIVVNIGSAEGYYAVGLARLLPAARIFAYDTDAVARDRCGEVARANAVDSRVIVRDGIEPEDFAEFAGARVFVVCDIDGGEYALFDPARAPALAGFDLLIEMHPLGNPSPAEFAARFQHSHDARVIQPTARDPSTFQLLAGLSPEDGLLALFERVEPTPWVDLRTRG